MNKQELSAFADLHDALNTKAAAGESVGFWLRDDDAVEPSAPLSRLLDLCRRHSVPLTLAVIPEHTGHALAHYLQDFEQVSVAVHGWAHANHAPAEKKKQELGDDRPTGQVLAELEEGLKKLVRLHGSRCVPVLVPPWNRVSQELLGQLPQAGFQAVSTFAEQEGLTLPMINTQVDIIYCKGGNGVRESDELVAELIEQLEKGATSIGLLTHHLVHTSTAWDFLENALQLLHEHPAAHWVSITELLNGHS